MSNIAKYFFKNFLCGICLIVLAITSSANTQEQVMPQILASVEMVDKTYQQHGMAGLQQLSEQCYRDVGQAYFCLYIDVASNLLDEAMQNVIYKKYGTRPPPYAYFAPVVMFKRFDRVYDKNQVNYEQRTEHLASVRKVISGVLSRQLLFEK